MQKIDGVHVSLLVPKEMLERIDALADRHKLTRSKAIRNMLETGLSLYGDFERVGLVRTAEILEQTRAALKREAAQLKLFRSA